MNWNEGSIKRKPMNLHFNMVIVAWRRLFYPGVCSIGENTVIDKFQHNRRRYDKDRRQD